VTGVRAGKLPVRGFDGGRRQWPRRLGENGEGGTVLGNKRTWEAHECLVKLLEQLVSGEREWGGELTAAAAMAGGAAGMARGGEEGGV
jgi:hypothetical protein